MLHIHDNWFFGRLENGAVEIVKLRSMPKAEDWPKAGQYHHDKVVSVTIDAQQWAHVASAVCARGESVAVYREAIDFHNAVGPIAFNGRVDLGTGQQLVIAGGRVVDVATTEGHGGAGT